MKFVTFIIWFVLFVPVKYSWSNEAVILLSHMTPYEMMLDHHYEVYLKIKNNDKFWPKDGKVKVTYHLLDLNKKIIKRDFVKTNLPKAVQKGESLELKAKVFFPSQKIKPGKYLLQWDFFEEGIQWYSSKNLIKNEFVYIKLVSQKEFILSHIKQHLKFFLAIFVTVVFPGSVILLVCFLRPFHFMTFLALSFLIGIAYINILYYLFNIFHVPLRKEFFFLITAISSCLGISFLLFKKRSYIFRIFNKKYFWEFLKDCSFFLPVLSCAAILMPAIVSHIAFPNIYDLSTHASFVRKIFDTGLSLVSQVFSFEVPWSVPEKGFYPLGSHRLIALLAHVSSLHPVNVTFLLFLYVICFSPLALILLVREFSLSRLHLLLIGMCVSFYARFPYQVIGWGGLPLLFGIILTPILLILVGAYLDRPSFKSSILLSLGMFSVFLVHPTELYVTLLLSLFFLFIFYKREIFSWKRVFFWSLFSLGILCLFLLPEIHHIFYLQFLRSTGHLIRPAEHWPLKFLFSLLGIQSDTVLSLFFLLVGFFYLFRLKKRLFWLVLSITLFFLLIGIIENYINTPFGNLWQHRMPRICYNTYFYVPILWGSGIYAFFRLFPLNNKNLWLKILFSFFVISCVWFIFHPQKICQQVSYYFDHYSGMNANDYMAINWLSNNLSQEDIILGQHGDSSLWIYPYTGLKIFGGRTHDILPYPDFPKRKNLQEKFITCKSDDLIKDLLAYKISYIYTSRTIVRGEFKAFFKKDCFIKNNKNLKLSYKNSDVSIYKVIP